MTLRNISAMTPTQKWVALRRAPVDGQSNVRAKCSRLGHYETRSVIGVCHGWR
jgi:hypothetical protein